MAVSLSKSSALSSLSLTPLIDVVFLLLIFFLVTTRFAEEDPELDIELPSANESRAMTQEPSTVFVNVDDAGGMFVKGQRVDKNELELVLRRAVLNNPVGQPVVIRADRRVSLELVVPIMDICNKVGVEKYSISTAKP